MVAVVVVVQIYLARRPLRSLCTRVANAHICARRGLSGANLQAQVHPVPGSMSLASSDTIDSSQLAKNGQRASGYYYNVRQITESCHFNCARQGMCCRCCCKICLSIRFVASPCGPSLLCRRLQARAAAPTEQKSCRSLRLQNDHYVVVRNVRDSPRALSRARSLCNDNGHSNDGSRAPQHKPNGRWRQISARQMDNRKRPRLHQQRQRRSTTNH